MTESQLRRYTAKGQYFSFLMSYNFLYDLGVHLAKKSPNNLASLYLFKYVFAEINIIKGRVQQRENVINNHPDWNQFTNQPEFGASFALIDRLCGQFGSTFENYYTSVIGLLAQSRPDVAQGITSNLGNGPTAPINSEIVIYELRSKWMSGLGTSPEDYFTKIQIMVALVLLEKKPIDLDFTAVERMKTSATVQDMVTMFESALKTAV